MNHKKLLACLVLTAALLPATAGAQERSAVSPSLEPLVQRPTPQIPEILRGPLGAHQGRKRLAGREALSLHLRTSASREELEALGARVRSLRNGRATITILPENLPALASHPEIHSIAVPRMAHPVLSKSLPDTGIPPLRTLSNGSFTGATGAGVVVGVIDSGIDLDHPNFADAQGNTRIAFLWDQTASTLPHPAPFGYGTECTAADIDGGLCAEQDNPAQFGHGTHVAGTAAGNGAAPDENGTAWSHVGVAPESTIVFVKSTLSTDDIIDGLEYIFAKADQLGLPAVINLSIGVDIGAHDGTDPMEETIDDLVTAKAGRAVVVAAGNSRGDAIHAEADTQQGVKVAGPTVFIPSYVAKPNAGDDLVLISGYYPDTDNLTVQVISPNGETHNRSLTSFGCSAIVNGLDGSVQICNSRSSNLDQATTANEILIAIVDNVASKPPRQGAWKINLTGNTVAGSGEADFWMFSRLGDDSDPAFFSTLADPSETVGIPGTSRQAITVGAHVTRLCWKDFNGTSQSFPAGSHNGEIAPFSSFGPTRDGRGKPEISAPGMGVIAPLAHEVRNPLISAGYGFLVVNDDYLLLQGTSMAAPHVTGAVALLLQDDPAATNLTLRSRLLSSARKDNETRKYDNGFYRPTNYAFGSGRLDLGRWAYNDPYETNDTPDQAYAVISGQTLSGYIERPDDLDHFQLQGVQAGDTIDLKLTSLPQDYSLSLLSPNLIVNTCAGTVLSLRSSSNNAGTADESIVFTLSGIQPALQGPASYIRVASPAGAIDGTDSYQLRALLTRPETSSSHSSAATAQKLPDFQEMKVTGAVSGTPDYYSFQVRPGRTLVLSAPGRTITIRDSNDAFVTNGFNSLSYTTPSGGLFTSPRTYYVLISGLAGSYILNLQM